MPIDYSKYCHDWKLRSRFVRFYRARNKCEKCSAENYKSHPVTGSKVILTVAHLDHDISNNSLSNLMAMCQRCHLRYDAKQHAATRRRNKESKEQLKLNF
jgi:hypothetical protein